RVTDIPQRRAVRQHNLPIRAGTGEQLPVQLRTLESPAAQRHDAPVALGDVAELERLAEGGLKPVDLVEARIGKLMAHGWLLFDWSLLLRPEYPAGHPRRLRRGARSGRSLGPDRVVRMRREPRDRHVHPDSEGQSVQQTVELPWAAGLVQAYGLGLA